MLISENPKTEDKRTIVVIRAIQQHLGRPDVFWVPTDLQWADTLTKLSDKLIERFMEWLRHPWIQLREVAKHPNKHSCQQSIGSVKFRPPVHERMS